MQRGKELEKIVNDINLKSRLNEESLILKIPVPIVMTKKGLTPMQSTVDFAGVLPGGKFIAFDAKETKVKTRFDLKNIKQHQLEYLEAVSNLGGIAFFLVWFKELYKEKGKESAFIFYPEFVREHWDKSSIPIKTIEENCPLIQLKEYLIKE